MGLTERLRTLLLGPPSDDGLARSLAEEWRWRTRFRAARRRPVPWRRPDRAEAQGWETHPVIGRFADGCVALAAVDGRRWVAMERTWHGWPDPPRFAWFALEADDAVWAAADLDYWPATWAPAP